VRLSVPESHLARGLDLMAMAVTRPTYAEREFEQEKRLRAVASALRVRPEDAPERASGPPMPMASARRTSW